MKCLVGRKQTLSLHQQIVLLETLFGAASLAHQEPLKSAQQVQEPVPAEMNSVAEGMVI